MKNKLEPSWLVEKVEQVTPEFLANIDIKGLILDIDNTLIPYSGTNVNSDIIIWLRQILAKGYKVCLVSNNSGSKGAILTQMLNVGSITYACKPRKKPFLKALKILDLEAKHTVVIGDQLFTDILGGNRAGMKTILVNPLSKKEFVGTKIMRLAEKIVFSVGVVKRY